MDIAKIAAIGMIAGTFSIIIRRTNPEISVQIGIATGVILLLMTVKYIAEAVDFIKEFADKYSYAYLGIAVVLKVIAIAYICEFAVQILRDGGEGAIASKVELCGKVAILILTLPLLSGFCKLVLSLLPG